MESFFYAASQVTELSPESRHAFAAAARRLDVPKDEVLVKADTVCNYIYFIESGITRTYYLRDGKDITDWISTENTFACSIVSFITRQPDIRIIETLEPCILWAFHHHELDVLYKQYHEIERFGRLLVSNGVVMMQRRFDELHFATAAERYRQLLLHQPAILQRVSLGMIASYLGITQETLSRIRNK